MKRKSARYLSMILVCAIFLSGFSGCSGCGKAPAGDESGVSVPVSTPISTSTVNSETSSGGNEVQTKDTAKEISPKNRDEIINALIKDYDFGKTENEYATEYFNNRIALLEYYLYYDSSLEAYSVYRELKEDADFIRQYLTDDSATVNSELDKEALLAFCDCVDSYDIMMTYVIAEGASEEYFEESWGKEYNYYRRLSSLISKAEASTDDFELLYSAIKMTVEEDYWYYIEHSSSQKVVDNFLRIIDIAEANDGGELPAGYPEGDSLYYERLAIKAYSIMKAYTKAADRAEYAYEKYGERDLLILEIENLYFSGNTSKVLEITKTLLQENPDDYEALYYAACAYILDGNYDFCIEYGISLAEYVEKGTYEQKEADYYLFNLIQKMTVLNDGSFGDNLGFYTKLSNKQKNRIHESEVFGTYIDAFRGAYDEAFESEKGKLLETDDLTKSLEYAEALINLLPGCAYPYYIYACLQYRLDDFEKAVTAAEYAVSLVPVDSMFYMLLASSYEELAMKADSDMRKEYWTQCYRYGVIARDMTPWVYNHDKDIYGVGIHVQTILDSGAEYYINDYFDKPENMQSLDMVSEDVLNKLASKYEELYGINDGYYLFHIAAMMENPDYGWRDIRAELEKIEDKTSEIYYFLFAEYNVRYESDSELYRVKAVSEAVYNNPLWDYSNTLLGTELVAEKKFEIALPYLQKAVAINPDNVYAWTVLGVCYYGQTFYGDAQEAFGRALELIEDETDPLYEFIQRYTAVDANAARYLKSLPVMENMYRSMFTDMYALYSMLDDYIVDDDFSLLDEGLIGTDGGYRYVVKRNANGYASNSQLKIGLEKSFKELWVRINYDTNINDFDFLMNPIIEDEDTPTAPRPNGKADSVPDAGISQGAGGSGDVATGEREAIKQGTLIHNFLWGLLGGGKDGYLHITYGEDKQKAEKERKRNEEIAKQRQEAAQKAAEEAKKQAESDYNYGIKGEGFDPKKAPGYYDDDQWSGEKHRDRVDNYYLILLMNAYREKKYGRAAEISRIMLERRAIGKSRGTINASDLNCKKPNIYIYSEEETAVTVTLGKPGKLTASDPIYKDSWTVTALPDGTLLYDGATYGYLFYECDVPSYEFKSGAGFTIRGDNRENDFRYVLGKYAFNEQETEDFIEFWVEYLEADKDYLMVPQDTAMVDCAMPLEISAEVESLTRLWFGFYEISEKGYVCEPEVTPITRDGFTVVEWGGAVVK